MKKFLSLFLIIIVSVTAISCGTKKDTETKKVATQEKADATKDNKPTEEKKNNKPTEEKKEDTLLQIDKLISSKLKDAKIEATVKTTDEKGAIVTVLDVTNNEELSKKDANPVDIYTLDVLYNNYIILANVVSSKVNGILPDSIVITTKSSHLEGYLRTIIVTKDVARITGKNAIAKAQSILALGVTESDNDKIKNSIKFIKEYK